MKKEQRLKSINEFLWQRGVFGATLKDIASAVGLSSESYVRSLIKELEKDGKIVQKKYQRSHDPNQYFAAHISLIKKWREETTTSLYTPIDSWLFDNNHCFLCGNELNKTNRSDEHIVPKWLQSRYNLWDQRLILANRTEIPYRHLKIPCCKSCNSNYLSDLENLIKNSHDNGFEAFLNLPRIAIYQWISKIFYGLLFKELSLLHDRRDPSLGYICSEQQLKSFRTLHYFLQSVRMPFVFRGFQPWSIFVIKLINFHDEQDFDYFDSMEHMIFNIRMGEIGIIVCLEDAGVQERELSILTNMIRLITLHPLQFDEFAAKVLYGKSLMNRKPKYLIKQGTNKSNPTEVTLLPLMGLSSKPLFDDWDSSLYARVLHQYWMKYNIPFEWIYSEPNLVKTMIFDEDENLLQLDKNNQLINKIPVPQFSQ